MGRDGAGLGRSRAWWRSCQSALLLVFVGFFASAHLAYLGFFFGTHDRAAELLVPLVFFPRACFVVLAARLMRRTIALETESATGSLTGLANRREFDLG